MRFWSFILHNLLRRKLRTLLTALGVAVAIGSVVALLGISYGFREIFGEVYQRRGVDIVVVRAGVAERMSSSLNEGLAPRIATVPGVDKVTPVLTESVTLGEEGPQSIPLAGWQADSFLLEDINITQGRSLNAQDKRGVMIGVFLADMVKKNVGDTMEIELEDFEVVGIFESFSVVENRSAVILLDELQALMDRDDQVTTFQVVVNSKERNDESIKQVAESIKNIEDENGKHYGLEPLPTADFVSSTSQIRLAEALAWMTSMVALVIGSVGMLNTMLMSVMERTREIGLLRAIGWRKSRVVRMIIGEALLLTLVGACCGTLGAMGLYWLLQKFPAAQGFIARSISLAVIVRGGVLALILGMLGGVYPALRGASLLPSEALRHD